MKLIGYELYKIWHKRIFAVLAILLLLLNGVFYYMTQREDHDMLIEYRDNYEQMELGYKELSLEEGMALSAKQAQQLALYSTFVQENIDSQDSVWKQLINDAISINKQAYEEYKQSPYFQNAMLISRDIFLIQVIKNQLESIEQFLTEINGMAAKAEEMLSVSIFYQKDSFSNRNILKTVEDFKALRNLPLELGLEEGLKTATSFWSTDLCLIVLLFLLCTILFQSEREDGLSPLIRTTRKGKSTTAGAKLFVLMVLTVLLALLYYGFILLIANGLFGFGDLNRHIQSMHAFSRTVEPMTVKQYLFLYFILKVAVNLFVALLLASIIVFLHHSSRIYMALALLLGGSYALYSLIHPNSYLNVFKYINIAAFYDTFYLLADYRNMNMFGFPFRKDTLTYLVGGALLLVLSVLCCWLLVSYRTVTSKASGIRWLEALKAYSFKLRRHNNLFQHEWYKLLITGKSILIIILACFIAYQHIEKEERRFDKDSIIYNRYVSQLDGELNEEKLNFLIKEREKFTLLPEHFAYWNDKYVSEQIDLQTYNLEKAKIEEFAKQEEIFQYVEKQRDYLLQLHKDQGIHGRFVNVISSDALFNRPKTDLLEGILYIIFLIVGLSPLFSLDYKNGMVSLLQSTHHGRWSLFAIKHLIAYLYGIFLLYIFQFPKFYNLIQQYPAIHWKAPIQSVEILGHVDLNVNVLEYVVLIGALQTLGIILLIHIALFIAVLVKKQALMLLTTTAVIMLPLCLQFMGVDILNLISLNPLFQLYHAFESNHYTLEVCIYFGVLLLIGISASWGSWYLSRGTRRG